MPSKVRPVLVVADPGGDDGGRDLLVLRLAPFSKLTAREQERVRAGEDQALFPLRPDRFPGLGEENAAIVATVLRIHPSALGSDPLGRLDQDALATLHHRIARHHRLDLRLLVARQIRRLQDARQARGA